MTSVKKVWQFLSSMRFALFLLVLLAAACAGASLVTQGQTAAWYQARYSPRTAGLILALQLDDAFHSWWFILISAFLCLNLLLCNLLRFPFILRRTREDPSRSVPTTEAADAAAEGVADPAALFTALGLSNPRRLTVSAERAADGTEPPKTTDPESNGAEQEILYAEKNRAGHWGAWVCHLGILLLIAGFGLGQALKQEYAAYGVPGQIRPLGDSGYTVSIDRFQVDTRPDGSVEQYTTDITITPPAGGGAAQSGTVSVNSPARLFGMSFYQNSIGWAAQIRMEKDGELLTEEPLCAGEYLPVPDKPELIVYFNAFYPDYVSVPGSRPASRSDQPVNPAYLYTVYYMGQILGMNVLVGDELLTIDEYTVTFRQPQRYTLIQAKRDAFTWLVFLGGIIMTAGLFLALYVQPVQVWAVREADGWSVRGRCRKGAVLFREQMARAVQSIQSAGTETENPAHTGDTPQ